MPLDDEGRVGAAERFIETRGARLRVRDEGEGPAALFLHGWALDLDIWEPQVTALASDYRVICIDRRGFGLSTADPSITAEVDDLRELLDSLRLERVALVSASQAIRVALRAALAFPERIACLVLDGPPDEVNEGTRCLTTEEIPIARYRELAHQGDIMAVRQAWASHPLTQLRTEDVALRARLAEIVARYPGRDLLRPGPGLPPSLGPRLKDIQHPALVINGEDDAPIRLASGALLASALPRARRELVPGACHLPNLDQPRIYTRLLVQFFKEYLDATN